MKQKNLQSRKPYIKKVYCSIIASCILLSSCEKDFASEKNSQVGNMMEVASFTPDIKSNSSPLPTPTVTFDLPKSSLKESDSLLNTSSAQIFCKYQGELNSEYYIMEFLLDDSSYNNFFLSGTYVIKFYNQSPLIAPEEKTIQEFNIPLDGYALWSAFNGMSIIDLNNDGMDDFILDLGITGQGKLTGALFFIYNSETKKYEQIGCLCNATFYREEGVIYEYYPGMLETIYNKYQIIGNELILLESLTIDSDPFPSVQFHPYPAYTYQKRIDGELVTVLEKGSKDEVDLSIWPVMDQKYRVK